MAFLDMIPGDVEITKGTVLRAFGYLLLALFARGFYKLYQARMLFRRKVKEYGVPMLPHSFWFGHLHLFANLYMKYPRDVSQSLMPRLLAFEYPEYAKHHAIYLDHYPISYGMLAVWHPDMMAQFTQDVSLPKFDSQLKEEFWPMTQGLDILITGGAFWKKWRSLFNTVFSAKNIATFVPGMVKEIDVFRKWMIEAAKSGKTVQIDDAITRMTSDIASLIITGESMGCQTQDHDLYDAIDEMTGWLIPDWQPRHLAIKLNPYRLFVIWRLRRKLGNYIMPRLEKMLRERGTGEKGSEKGSEKSVMSVGVDDALKRARSTGKVDPDFKRQMMNHINLFVFAGQDTASITLTKSLHILGRNPAVLAALRAELDEVLGPDVSQGPAKISEEPHLLNSLPYTTAVLKEVLRLNPPVGSIRKGDKSVVLTHPETGQKFPTEGMMMFATSYDCHRCEDFWVRPLEVIPERWFAKPGEELYPRKNAYRPFELGPRGCIGQEYAMTESRAFLALIAREFDWDIMYPKDAPRLEGDECYQIAKPGKLTPHAKDGLPIRVRLRDIKV